MAFILMFVIDAGYWFVKRPLGGALCHDNMADSGAFLTRRGPHQLARSPLCAQAQQGACTTDESTSHYSTKLMYFTL